MLFVRLCQKGEIMTNYESGKKAGIAIAVKAMRDHAKKDGDAWHDHDCLEETEKEMKKVKS